MLSVDADAPLLPTAFAADAVQVYAVPLLRPVTSMVGVELVPVKVLVPSVQLAAYSVMSAAPLSATETVRRMVPSS